MHFHPTNQSYFHELRCETVHFSGYNSALFHPTKTLAKHLNAFNKTYQFKGMKEHCIELTHQLLQFTRLTSLKKAQTQARPSVSWSFSHHWSEIEESTVFAAHCPTCRHQFSNLQFKTSEKITVPPIEIQRKTKATKYLTYQQKRSVHGRCAYNEEIYKSACIHINWWSKVSCLLSSVAVFEGSGRNEKNR